MKKSLILFALATVFAGILFGCSSVEDKAALVVSDKEGVVEPRTVTVGYVNERLERVPAEMIPDVPGDEGKRQFMEDIVRKEILVIYGTRIGVLEDERLPGALEYFEDSRAEEMLREELIVGPAQVTPEEVEDYYSVREDLFQLQEIIVSTEEEANDAYRRVTEGGEDFARVAMEVSRGSTAQDGGRMQVTEWKTLHPLIRVAVRHLDKDDITEPFRVGYAWEVYKVLSRKDPNELPPLEGATLAGITAEARNFNRTLLEYYVFTEWDEQAEAVWQDDAVDVCGTRIDEEFARMEAEQEESDEPEDEMFTNQMKLQVANVVPVFTEEEAGMLLVSYNILGEPYDITLGDYAQLCEGARGGTTARSGSRLNIEGFIKRHIQEQTVQEMIDRKGYRGSQEMADYLALRTEEFIIDVAYEREVLAKVEDPTGDEIRSRYRDNLEKYKETPAVDVQMLIVATEGQANRIKQRIEAGETTFTEMVQTHSIEDWSKAKDGIVLGYHQGEDRLSFLQDIAFDLEKGVVSDPVRAPGGYSLVKVLETYPERQRPFSEVAEVVKQAVMAKKREALLTALLDSARESVDIEYVEENFQYINDPVEVLKEKGSGSQKTTMELR